MSKVTKFPTLDDINVAGKTVLVRCDLNVPMEGGRVTDDTRIMRLIPTLKELAKQGARVVVLSHFGRPEGKFERSMSLAPLVDPLAKALGAPVRFGVDCIGAAAREAVQDTKLGGVALLENVRFYPGEEDNDEGFARSLAELGDIYINDAFSCSHRAHASIAAITKLMPSAAGRLFQQEVEALESVFSTSERPLAAIVGGSKVSTKLELLQNLVEKMDVLIIGGAMANTFLLAKGHEVGRSICERGMVAQAKEILSAAEQRKCEIVLPVDLVVTEKFAAHAPCRVVMVENIPVTHTAVDVGPQTVGRFAQALINCHTIVWNGPVGAFETSPFDASTIGVARVLARLAHSGCARVIAGGGDTVAAVAHAGLSEEFTYLSTAGGAFLEWMEGRELPGVAALQAHVENKNYKKAKEAL